MDEVDPGESDAPDLELTLRLPPRYHLGRTLRIVRMGPYDPATTVEDARAVMALRTPAGPVSLEVVQEKDGARARAWGEGAGWLESRIPPLLGLDDTPEAFQPTDPVVRRLWRRFGPLWLARLPRLFDRVVQTVLLQLVTTNEGYRAWRGLVRELGEPAPGPFEVTLPPAATTLASTPPYVMQSVGVLARQARTIGLVARRVRAIEAAAERGPDALAAALSTLPGIGPWTVQYVLGSGMGFADAVLTGDYNLPHRVAFALTGAERADDGRMLELLEPYRGHRFRVIRLLWLGGVRPPRRGPRRAPRKLTRLD